MKTMVAHFRKDVASTRALFWAWIICVLIDCLGFLTRLPISHLSLGGNGMSVMVISMIGIVTGVLASFMIQGLLFVVLVVRVIQVDPLTEPDAFWRTRPISRGILLTEKSLFIMLLVAGSLLAGWALNFKAGPEGRAVSLLHAAVFVTGLVAFAAVTSDFSKLIVTFLVVALGTHLAALICLQVTLTQHVWLFYPAKGHLSWAKPEPLEISALYLAAFISVIVWQYLTLRTNVSRFILAATCFLVTLWQGG